MKKTILTLMVVSFGICFSCSEKKTDSSKDYDPHKEMKITSFMPDSSGARAQMVIEGVNFGSDPSKVHVYFSDQRVPASVMSVNGTSIYCIVPPSQPDGLNDIYVQVEGQESFMVEKKFRYVVQEQVSLLTGQPDRGGDTDGTLSSALFNRLFAVFAVDGGSLFTFGDGSPRLVSIRDNAVITIQSGVRILNGCMTKDRKTVYGVSLNRPHALYRYTKDNLWMPELVTSSINIDKDLFACTLDDTQEWIYFYVAEWAETWRLNLNNPTILEKHCDQVGSNTGYWGGMTYSEHDDCFYVAAFDLSGIFKISKDGSVCENFVGFKGQNYINGLITDAGTPNPAGIVTDSKGNIYFTEVLKRTVRKVDLKTNMVTTLAGIKDAWGDQGGPPLEAKFRQPYGICIDQENNFYVTSSEDGWGTIRKIAIE